MAWILWRTDSSARVTAQLKWRDPDTRKIRSRALGPVDAASAEQAKREIEHSQERRDDGPQSLTARQALAKFLAHLRFLRRSPQTVRFYRDRLGPMFRALEESAQFARWTPRHLEAYLSAHPDWSPRTVQMNIYAARRFVRWAARRVRCPDFVEDLRGPVVRSRETPHYAPAEIRVLLADVEGSPHELAIALACLAGLSLADLRTIRWEQVRLGDGLIVGERSKTHIPFRVPILPELRVILKRLRPLGARGPICELPARADSARNVARRACTYAGLKRGGWHRLRHSFGALLDEAGASLAEIRTAMGHAPQSTITLRYLHADDRRVRDVAEAAQRALDGASRTGNGR